MLFTSWCFSRMSKRFTGVFCCIRWCLLLFIYFSFISYISFGQICHDFHHTALLHTKIAITIKAMWQNSVVQMTFVQYLFYNVCGCDDREPKAPHLLTWMTLNPKWISNYTRYKVSDEIAYPILNFNCCTAEVCEWMSNFTPHLIGHMNKVNPCW